MSALRIMSFTSTLHLTRDRMLEKQTRRRAVATRISCCNPSSAGVDKVACKQQQAHEDTLGDTLQSNPVAAKAASTATDDAYTTQNTTKLLGEIHAESEWDAYCDVLPDSRVCQQEELLHLTPSSPISDLEEEPCEFECVARGSKKPQRLSFTSWDLLD